jgi:hypothetical protein
VHFAIWVAVEDSISLLVSYGDTRKVLVEVAALVVSSTTKGRDGRGTHEQVWMTLG